MLYDLVFADNLFLEGESRLPDPEGVQDVGITPGESLGRCLGTGVLVDLFVHTAPVGVDVSVQVGHDGVSGFQLFQGQVLHGCALLQVEQVHPGLVLIDVKDPVGALGLNVLEIGGSSEVQDLGEDGCQKLPGVATGVAVSGVSVSKEKVGTGFTIGGSQ